MDPALRVVTKLPLDGLWNDAGPVQAAREVDLAREGVAARLREGAALVVATVGEPLQWLEADERFAWWKTEAKPRLLDPRAERWGLEDLPDERGWRASEWTLTAGRTAVLFEEYH